MLKKIILVALLFATPLISFAQNWVKVSSSDLDNIYIDTISLKKIGNNRRVWVLSDYKKRDKGGDSSNKVLSEFDCAEDRVKNLDYTMFKGNMGNGTVTDHISSPNSAWQYVSPGSVDDFLLKFVCKK